MPPRRSAAPSPPLDVAAFVAPLEQYLRGAAGQILWVTPALLNDIEHHRRNLPWNQRQDVGQHRDVRRLRELLTALYAALPAPAPLRGQSAATQAEVLTRLLTALQAVGLPKVLQQLRENYELRSLVQPHLDEIHGWGAAFYPLLTPGIGRLPAPDLATALDALQAGLGVYTSNRSLRTWERQVLTMAPSVPAVAAALPVLLPLVSAQELQTLARRIRPAAAAVLIPALESHVPSLLAFLNGLDRQLAEVRSASAEKPGWVDRQVPAYIQAPLWPIVDRLLGAPGGELARQWTDNTAGMVQTASYRQEPGRLYPALRFPLSDATRLSLVRQSLDMAPAASLNHLVLLSQASTLTSGEIASLAAHPVLTPAPPGATAPGVAQGGAPVMKGAHVTGLLQRLLYHPNADASAQRAVLATWQRLGLAAHLLQEWLTTRASDLLLDPAFRPLLRSAYVQWTEVLAAQAATRPDVARHATDQILTGQGPAVLMRLLDRHPTLHAHLDWAAVLAHPKSRASSVRFRMVALSMQQGVQVDAEGMDAGEALRDRARRIRSAGTATTLLRELVRGQGAAFTALSGDLVLRLFRLAALGAPSWQPEVWASLSGLREARLPGEAAPALVPQAMRLLLVPHLRLPEWATTEPVVNQYGHYPHEEYGRMALRERLRPWTLPPITLSSELPQRLPVLAPVARVRLARLLRGHPYLSAAGALTLPQLEAQLAAVTVVPRPAEGESAGARQTPGVDGETTDDLGDRPPVQEAAVSEGVVTALSSAQGPGRAALARR